MASGTPSKFRGGPVLAMADGVMDIADEGAFNAFVTRLVKNDDYAVAKVSDGETDESTSGALVTLEDAHVADGKAIEALYEIAAKHNEQYEGKRVSAAMGLAAARKKWDGGDKGGAPTWEQWIKTYTPHIAVKTAQFLLKAGQSSDPAAALRADNERCAAAMRRLRAERKRLEDQCQEQEEQADKSVTLQAPKSVSAPLTAAPPSEPRRAAEDTESMLADVRQHIRDAEGSDRKMLLKLVAQYFSEWFTMAEAA